MMPFRVLWIARERLFVMVGGLFVIFLVTEQSGDVELSIGQGRIVAECRSQPLFCFGRVLPAKCDYAEQVFSRGRIGVDFENVQQSTVCVIDAPFTQIYVSQVSEEFIILWRRCCGAAKYVLGKRGMILSQQRYRKSLCCGWVDWLAA